MKITRTHSMLAAVILSATTLSVSANNSWEKEAKDAWIDGKAESTLLLNTNLNSFKIDTDVKAGVVTLTGTVDSNVDKALAEELIETLEGVKSVDNQIVVKQKDDEKSEMMSKLTDSKVATVVKTRLLFESEVSGTDINVDVKGGVVTLTGDVDSSAEHDLAIAIAKNTDDVKDVIDKLEVVQ
ncbi:BON domain-containing protein [Catenovulum sp. 2E275]|uniref:BON domain-containing protein n=1 Tax=Catenovulum sp. 2E275 TaxID=2980497 RepID=UPI0021CEA836|nr:BON domain-containing protein [Catenovulum sp. 2E275]MCU4675478.1 BON domain-containing protein [Catenovulum sp. 2E275]